ncbi:alpha-amylase family glycosyl hydrolase [Flavobacterium alkalisoli]|uniref:alpha-amylase family glycosyl hydrolase n=1 Tax=Flavobacterium alkalisoli TaxID=2602769 RepID=UPI003A8E81FC
MLRKVFLMSCLFFAVGASAQKEVIYQVFQRSFFDSNGDGTGDFKGIQQKMDYLQMLGVNAIMLSPIYQSDVNNNLYATDWSKTDTAYGSLNEYRSLVQEAHRRKMKVYQDLDLRYVNDKHEWYTDKTKYKDYLLLKDNANKEYTNANREQSQAIAVNFKKGEVRGEIVKMLQYWINPDGSSSYYSGVDGFRFSNVSDDFGGQSNLLREFWVPVIKGLRDTKADLLIMASPADDKYTNDDFYNVGFDAVFDRKLRDGIVSFDKKKLENAIAATMLNTPENKAQMVFVSGYDVGRFANAENYKSDQLKALAALNVFLGGKPVIYYGEELGTPHIDEVKGMERIIWQRGDTLISNTQWYMPFMKADGQLYEAMPVAEQIDDKQSLFSFYKQLLGLKNHPALTEGQYVAMRNENEYAVSFLRVSKVEKLLFVINLSDEEQRIYLNPDIIIKFNNSRMLLGDKEWDFVRGGRAITLPPYGVAVWQLL